MTCMGEILQGDPGASVRGVCTDSRGVRSGELFVALKGERLDGHEFAAEAVRRGAAAVLGEAGRLGGLPGGCAVVGVGDTRQALASLAASHRRRFELPVIAVAGSNGKTTTKDLVASVLGQRFQTLASEASFNNSVGVPLSLLRLDRSHQAAVLEVGTNHPGELAPLVRMIQPGYGVLTTLGREHLEFFGGMEGVTEEEGWLAELLPPGGKLFLPGEVPGIERVLRRTRAQAIRVGWGAANDWRVTRALVDGAGTILHVRAPRAEWSGEYRLRLLGRHQVTNALLALAVGGELGLSRAEMAAGLVACRPPKMRLQHLELGGLHILDDSYNANADSMLASLETLSDLAEVDRCIAVLGDMAELGEHSEPAHAEVGRQAASLGLRHLFAVGRMAPVMGAAAREAGLPDVREFGDSDAAAVALRGFVRPGDWVLVKASRATRLERIVERLKEPGAGAPA
jgi:UDP-N-acetylmuramoyl-tripeptide--D-alanyl-D-alanine ligase